MAAGSWNEATRQTVASFTGRLRDDLGAHLAHEERDGMVLAQKHLTQEDWDRLDTEVFAKDYRLREVPAVLGWVLSGLDPEAARRTPGANVAFLVFGRLMARRFDGREARIFGTRPAARRQDRILTVVSRVVAGWHVRLNRGSRDGSATASGAPRCC